MGTMLLDGHPPGPCLEELCVSDPDRVLSIHAGFIEAGARLIRTNSFGANAVRLARHGFANRVNEFAWTAARLGRDAVRGKPVFVAGSVGPLGIDAAELTARGLDRKAVFQEQIGALLDGGVDLVFLETFYDLDELLLALDIKHALHHCPVVCSLACPPGGRLPSGLPVGEVFARLVERGADVVGFNCMTPDEILPLLSAIPAGVPLSFFPSAGAGGVPSSAQTEALRYPLSPGAFAAAGKAATGSGARLLGGCCGTRPEHIAALAAALKENE